jgi:hypothetical protein
MAQDVNDPNVQAYYRKQRLQAEAKALGGDASAASEVGKIGAKLQRSGSARQRSIGTTDREIAAGPAANSAQDKTNDFLGDVALAAGTRGVGLDTLSAVKGLGPIGPEVGRAVGPVGAFIGSAAKAAMKAAKGMGKGAEDLIEHPAAAEEMARHVGRQVARRIFPDADEAAEGASRTVRRGAQRAQQSKPIAQAGSRRTALPENASKPVAPKPKPAMARDALIEEAGRAARKRTTAQARKIVKSVQKPGKDPIAASGSARKALPAPDPGRSMRGKQMAKVKAGTPRAKQVAPRDTGTNPRAQEGYVRGANKKTKPPAEVDETAAKPKKKKSKASS